MHGSMNIQNCLVDPRWMIKLVGFGMEHFVPPMQGLKDANTGEVQGIFYIRDGYWPVFQRPGQASKFAIKASQARPGQ